MHTKAPQEPPDPNFKWEVRDLDLKMMAKAAVGLYIMVLITAPLCVWIMDKMGANVLSEGPGHQDLRRIPVDPYPLLQDNATAAVDMHNLRREEKTLLNTEGTAVGGRPRISISQAIEMEAQRVGK